MDTTSHVWRAPRSACRPIVAFAIASAVITGCRANPVNPFLAQRPGSADHSIAADSEGPISTGPIEASLLTSSAWTEKAVASSAKPNLTEPRWTHPRIDPLLRRRAENRVDLAELMTNSDPVVAANATIVAAHWGAAQPEQVALVIRETQLPINLRSAAAEALGMLKQPSPTAQIRELLEQVAPAAEDVAARPPGWRAQPDLHAELLRGLARHATPEDEPWFKQALADSSWKVRAEAALVWNFMSDQSLPAEVVKLREDRDPRVRSAALWTIAARRETRAVEYLKQGLNDPMTDVQAAAMAALTDMGASDARALVNNLQNRGSELQQAAALAAQAARGARDDLQSAAQDAKDQAQLAAAYAVDEAKREGREMAQQAVLLAEERARETVAQASDEVRQTVDDAREVLEQTRQRVREVQQLVTMLREADLSGSARREGLMALERLAYDADMAVRIRAAQAMGEVADPALLPVLMAMLDDSREVRVVAMVSLNQVAGSDVTKTEGKQLSDEERVRLWQMWYREQQDQRVIRR